jgi:protein transport protein SEC61 subunit gamma and related proteins
MEDAIVQQPQQKEEPKAQKPKGPSIFSRIKNVIASYKRVIDVARKPTRDEFTSSAKITAAGIVFIGAIGFAIFLLYFLVTG